MLSSQASMRLLRGLLQRDRQKDKVVRGPAADQHSGQADLECLQKMQD